ncbi:hypothetical protein BAnh1_02770 [Bartonella australis AUST/NH1]|uniref:PF07598 family protein n=1 Tax=Bartonella australis (strain Aust/NH1) TaxID=1094489 RepID=M1P2V9_BARAA|nr:DUF1561 family protein [Bartonella australis]AGF74160.1 hypothetical protein BAnh1_02770 [Bartonella australis AUST/NH1]
MKHSEVLLINFDLGSWRLMEKTSLRFLSFFFAFLLSLNSLLAAPIHQKPTDKPIDKPIRVKVHNGWEYCYTPAFVDGESYVYLDNCSSSSVQAARYDVFQRVAWKVKNVWLCMTAPNSVTGVGRRATADWDYIRLRPCVINDANQRWIIKGRVLYTADEKFRVKDHKWYAYISKNKGDYYDHTLSSTMDTWIDTIATPGNMSFKTSLGWKFTGTSGFNIYYISDDGSKPEIFDLYYNPENGHIARYFPSAGLLSCMASQQSPSEDWNWVKWLYCNDNISSTKDRGYWNVSFLVGREGLLLDRGGNILRVTQYGSNWGIPYTVKPDYIKKDTQNSPKSEFVLSYDIERWNRYATANMEDTLPYCPAPGKKQDVSRSKQRVKRTLPSDFQLSDEWIQRLHAIMLTRTGAIPNVGICGVCLLHAFQMMAELRDRFPDPPRPRGYFFDITPNTDPIASLQRRYPSLHRALELALTLYGISTTPRERIEVTRVRGVAAIAQIILPAVDWTPSNITTDRASMLGAIRRLLMAPPGTMWLGLSTHIIPGGGENGHAFPILRSSRGLIMIQTNAPDDLPTFSRLLGEVSDPDAILSRIIELNGLPITTFAAVRMSEIAAQPLNVIISQNNCSGEGEGRRGSREPPRSSFVSQCISGRCTLL